MVSEREWCWAVARMPPFFDEDGRWRPPVRWVLWILQARSDRDELMNRIQRYYARKDREEREDAVREQSRRRSAEREQPSDEGVICD